MAESPRLIPSPKVYMLARQALNCGDELDTDLKAFLENETTGAGWWSDAESDAEFLVETAGRLCYQSFDRPRPGGNKAYIGHVKAVNHGSVFEHAVWTLGIAGISRACSHELVRHRTGMSPSQLSQRYVDCSDVAFVVPPAMRRYHDEWSKLGDNQCQLRADPFQRWVEAREGDLEEYREWTDRLSADAPEGLTGTERRKWARQAARSVLPECTETKLVITANARMLRHAISLRASRHADAEIRSLFCKIHALMLMEAYELFCDYRRVDLADGSYELVSDLGGG